MARVNKTKLAALEKAALARRGELAKVRILEIINPEIEQVREAWDVTTNPWTRLDPATLDSLGDTGPH